MHNVQKYIFLFTCLSAFDKDKKGRLLANVYIQYTLLKIHVSLIKKTRQAKIMCCFGPDLQPATAFLLLLSSK